MALRFARRISAIFSHSLKVSGIQCNKPTLPFSESTQMSMHTVHTHTHRLTPATPLTQLARGAENLHSTSPCSVCAHACSRRRALVCGHKRGQSLAPRGAVSIFDSESIIFNLSEGICVMKADANSNKRGEKTQQHNSSEKARANPCSDAIITHNQIRADLNRHRTQNHIKGNSMCMALHCSQSPLFSLSALPSLILSLTFLLHFSLSFFLSVFITIAS